MSDDVYNRLVTEFREVCEEAATLQRENARLRQALWDAHEDFDCCEEAQEYQARIRAALAHSAAPGEGETNGSR